MHRETMAKILSAVVTVDEMNKKGELVPASVIYLHLDTNMALYEKLKEIGVFVESNNHTLTLGAEGLNIMKRYQERVQ